MLREGTASSAGFEGWTAETLLVISPARQGSRLKEEEREIEGERGEGVA